MIYFFLSAMMLATTTTAMRRRGMRSGMRRRMRYRMRSRTGNLRSRLIHGPALRVHLWLGMHLRPCMYLRLRMHLRLCVRLRARLRMPLRLEMSLRLRMPLRLEMSLRLCMFLRTTGHRPGHSRRRGTAMIHSIKSTPVLTRKLLMLRLRRSRTYMTITQRHFLCRRWPGLYPMRTTVIARPVPTIVDHRSIDICIMDHRRIYPGNGRIVTETSANPFTAGITYTAITTAIVDTAIKTYMRSPITGMPEISPA